MSNKPKRLLEKYDILLEHLDYGYIEKCTDGSELEKIIKILRSGQEGHYPDLMAFAMRQLKSIKPGSKLFRQETPLVTKNSMASDRWDQINQDLTQWEKDMQNIQNAMLDGKEDAPRYLPPVRTTSLNDKKCSSKTQQNRIKSSDYENWDRYDPDAEILKMDLEEERHKEFIMKRNERNSNDRMIQEVQPDDVTPMTEAERKILAIKYKEKGNDYFRSKEYQHALSEYNNSIALYPLNACFNNRAIANIKLMRYKEAISDCEKCLEGEPNNLKALCRKAEALKLDDKRREAYQTYCQILQLDSKNKLATDAIEDLRRQLPDLPPANSFPLQIEEVANEDDDYAALVKPKKIIKDKLPEAVQSLKAETVKMVQKAKTANLQDNNFEILTQPSKKVLIEEIN
ncbi:AAEL012096-PA [Aedes aegypti]|uniref:AAEL012096-PA n=2 Tax=Aedes aegypti TaxID=7159 RepID=A0A1S4FV50_AEDAE|nr:sperm-associated antigen 1 [Aedes aegypti]EAT35747.1 AAEL012096-PA [Aedes aegypti]